MDYFDPASEKANFEAGYRKPRIVLAACGSAAAEKFGDICSSFTEWAEVKAVLTKSSMHFVLEQTFPTNVPSYCDDHDWHQWKRIGDKVLHIELLQWADALVIAPLSANTLGKIAQGLCDNLLTCIVRAWDYSKKPLFVAPSMTPYMWRNPATERYYITIDDLGITLIDPVSGAMAEPKTINSTVRGFFEANK